MNDSTTISTALSRLVSQSDLTSLISTFHLGQDTLDGPLLKSCFSSEARGEEEATFMFDLSGHLAEFQARQVTVEEFWGMVKGVLPGFEGTMHLVGNFLFEFHEGEGEREGKEEKCMVGCYCVAYHCFREEEGEGKGGLRSVTARVRERFDCARRRDAQGGLWGKWVVRGLKVERDVPLDFAEVYGLARKRVEEGKGRNVVAEL